MKGSLQHLIGLVFHFTCNQAVQYKDPYPFLDDDAVRSDDQVTPALPVSGGIPINGHWYSNVYASTNGIITFDYSETTYTPVTLQNKQSSSQKPLIAVFWTDIYPAINNAALYYDTYSTGDSVLNRATSEIRYFTGSTIFSATWMMVVTWFDSPLYCCRDSNSETLTIQAVLVTDGCNTYAMFNYIDVNMTVQSQNIAIGWVTNETFYQNPLSFTNTAYKMSLQHSNTRDSETLGYLLYELNDGTCPCKNCNTSNTASCLDEVNNYTCVCLEGYTGRHCEIDIDECVNNSCNTSNTASCLDEVNNYTCVCLEGYTGRHCEIDIDECVNDSCNTSNTASCLDEVNNYTCVCLNKYFGKICDEQNQGGCACGSMTSSSCIQESKIQISYQQPMAYRNIPSTIQEVLYEREANFDCQQVPDSSIVENKIDAELETTLMSIETGELTPLIKEELKYTIQSRRLAEGKPELEVKFEERRNNELRPDEVEKVERRREQNRLAAQRFRRKQKSVGDILRKRTQKLTAENTRLRTELHRVQSENEQLRMMLMKYQNGLSLPYDEQRFIK